jgi:hypothetical protein
MDDKSPLESLIHNAVHQAAFSGREELREKALSAEERQAQIVDQLAREQAARKSAAIENIPAVVRQLSAEGHHHGVILRLRFDESTEHPNDMNGFWDDHHYPRPELLSGAARDVYDLCAASNLRPYVIRDYDFTIQRFFLYLGIQWTQERK